MDIVLETIPEVVIIATDDHQSGENKNTSSSNIQNNDNNIQAPQNNSEIKNNGNNINETGNNSGGDTATANNNSIGNSNSNSNGNLHLNITNTTTIVVADGASSTTLELADSIKQVASPVLSSQPTSSSGKTDHTHRYRHYLENKINSSSVRDDGLSRELTNFPDDNIQLSMTQQQHRTKESTITVETLPSYIQCAIESFSAPRKTVVRQYQRYRKEAERLVHFDNDKYDCDIERETEKSALGSFAISNQPDSKDINTELLAEYQPGETERANTDLRSKGRVGFFRYFRPDYNWGSGMEVSICNRLPHDIWTKPNYMNVLIELKGLVFMLGELEPFFCSLFIYDAASKSKLSETFHFDFNSEQMRQLLAKHSEPADPVTQAKHLVVSLPVKQMSDIWIVVRINKVMQGDPDLVKEPYMKLEEKDVKAIKKNKAKVSDIVSKFCERLGQYTQPFCCSVVRLTENGDVKYGAIDTDALFKVVPKDNADIDDLIADYKDPARQKKLRLIPGTLSLNIFKPANDLPPHTMRLDPSLDLVVSGQPFNTRLPSSNSILVNSNINNNNNANSNTNILAQTSNGDVSPTSSSSSTSSNNSSPATSSPVLQRQQTMIRGATLLSIVPVIREVQCLAKEEPIPNSEFINNLYIYPDTVNLSKAHGRNVYGYLKADENDYTLLESGKSLFKVNINLKSSIYPQNTYLNRFFLQSNNSSISDNDMNQLLNDFNHIDAAEAIRYLPVIIRQLILVMCNRDATVGCNAIKAMFITISKIQQHLGEPSYRVPLLVSYISHVFDNPKDTKIPVYSALCSRFVYFLMVKKYSQQNNNSNNSNNNSSNNSESEISNATLFSYCWFIFDLIIKSLSLTALESPEMLKGNREGKFDGDFIKYVPKMVSFVIHHFHAIVDRLRTLLESQHSDRSDHRKHSASLTASDRCSSAGWSAHIGGSAGSDVAHQRGSFGRAQHAEHVAHQA
ncbi:DOCK family protein [Heterostelium album PN500]|uniref:DOCK family protein n=1 Tax=Heterostelium pallidum (strain ATCC 26659 / Pp 5 / PN500) TaxID=670386 RepID=D3BJQ1_HETP5|nr:DOCK family protein [Heterostelium album PN500]EFA78131.1 DOCK family protein [Heterostelium album PN500]|eukprot:XP_020430257.1 DOCK family protein [Heterostelium album PN500]